MSTCSPSELSLTFVYSATKSKSQYGPGLSPQTKAKHNKVRGEISCAERWRPAARREFIERDGPVECTNPQSS